MGNTYEKLVEFIKGIESDVDHQDEAIAFLCREMDGMKKQIKKLQLEAGYFD